MNGKDKERSFSEVGDTLRYFNSMASSHSWCCSKYNNSALALVELNKLKVPLHDTDMATVAAKALAVASAAVSVEEAQADATSLSSDGGIIFMNDSKRVLSTPDQAIRTNEQSKKNLLSPFRLSEGATSAFATGASTPSATSSNKPVSILLTAPSDNEFAKLNEHEVLSDPSLITTSSPAVQIMRRASDDCHYYSNAPNRLQVVHLTDNPFLQHREASDGVLALREDRERQRRHSSCYAPTRNGPKSLKDWFQNFSSSQRGSLSLVESSLFNRPHPPLVPEVVVSHHSSENLAADHDEDIRREMANRDRMAKTVQKYLILSDSTPLKDKLFTAGLLALTMLGILVLFWYQNFGPGFSAFNNYPRH